MWGRRKFVTICRKECNVTGIDRSEERISQAISYFNLLGFNGRFIHSDF